MLSKDSENIDRIFQLYEDAKTEASGKISLGTGHLSRKEAEWTERESPAEQELPETEYRLIQPRDDRRLGCLGGLMYATFILCVSIILACLAWMAASDALALNKESFTATVVLPDDIFTLEAVDVTDDEGNVTGTRTVTHADIDYLSKTLKQAGLIEYRWLFEFYCSIANADEKVKPGEYELQSTYDYRAMIQNMRPNAGGAVTVNVTFPEGMTMQEMFVLLERQGVSSYEDLMEAAANYHFNYDFLDEIDDDSASRLEGYLFPDTYNFYVNMQASSTISKFLDQFNSNLSEAMLQKLALTPLSLRDVVTIASMIEKEAADDGERANIASVIYNRLNYGMNLGIDATILYVHPDHRGAPTAAMLTEKSPYNTRLNTGLPPSPICNPGLASLEAAFNPASTDYFFYALDTESGRHRFFTNQAEFDAFVATQDY